MAAQYHNVRVYDQDRFQFHLETSYKKVFLSLSQLLQTVVYNTLLYVVNSMSLFPICEQTLNNPSVDMEERRGEDMEGWTDEEREMERNGGMERDGGMEREGWREREGR